MPDCVWRSLQTCTEGIGDDVHYDPLCECAFEIDHHTGNNSLRTVCGFFNVPKRVHGSIMKGIDKKKKNEQGFYAIHAEKQWMEMNQLAKQGQTQLNVLTWTFRRFRPCLSPASSFYNFIEKYINW